MNPLEIYPGDASRIWKWLNERGGLLIWNCLDLCRPGMTWTTPAQTDVGEPTPKPDWAAGDVIRQITDPNEVVVLNPRVVKAFHVAVRQSGGGLKLTEAASRRVELERKKATAKHKTEAWIEFDHFDFNNALILVSAGSTTLPEFIQQQHAEAVS